MKQGRQGWVGNDTASRIWKGVTLKTNYLPTLDRSDYATHAPILLDKFGRQANYLRLAVTDRCNLRCRYCMPNGANDYLGPQEILSFEEMERLVKLLVKLGITKIRLTGGEPFSRPGIMAFLRNITTLENLEGVFITTNGVLAAPYIEELKALGIAGINLSLDTLQKKRFMHITQRDEFDAVIECLFNILQYRIPLKINVVLQDDLNIDEIIPMVNFAKSYPVQVRFIEQMPFNGTNHFKKNNISSDRILKTIKQVYPSLQKIDQCTSTAEVFGAAEFKGQIGIINGYSRTFCHACNRVRITARGFLKTCLYGKNVLDLRELIRSPLNDSAIQNLIVNSVAHKFRDGHIAENMMHGESLQSMAAIGG